MDNCVKCVNYTISTAKRSVVRHLLSTFWPLNCVCSPPPRLNWCIFDVTNWPPKSYTFWYTNCYTKENTLNMFHESPNSKCGCVSNLLRRCKRRERQWSRQVRDHDVNITSLSNAHMSSHINKVHDMKIPTLSSTRVTLRVTKFVFALSCA